MNFSIEIGLKTDLSNLPNINDALNQDFDEQIIFTDPIGTPKYKRVTMNLSMILNSKRINWICIRLAACLGFSSFSYSCRRLCIWCNDFYYS